MVSILNYNEFIDKLKEKLNKNYKTNLINKIAKNPNRYIGVFRFTTPEIKLIKNIIQFQETIFEDFVEDIITEYLGKYYKNLEKRTTYKNEVILFDQLFEYNNKIFMIEQKMRDDHDSTKKRGQFENFIKKVEYLKETYPDKQIEAGMWFVDQTLVKNKKYYFNQIQQYQDNRVKLHLFYGNEFTNYLDKVAIWDEMTEYLFKWKISEENKIELNFEEDWEDTKKELLDNVSKNSWKKIINNNQVVEEVLPILFPTGKYKEILKELNIKNQG